MRKTFRLLVVTVCAYAALWALTARYGNANVRASTCDNLKSEWHAEVSGREDLRSTPWPAYYCRSHALAPFVVSLSFDYGCGPLCGRGAIGFIVWFPGLNAPFYQRSGWAS